MRVCLLRFGHESHLLCEAVAAFTRWLSTDSPPWAAYRALMSGRLIALDKMPGIRPIGIGETWRRLFAKSVIEDSGAEVVEACGCKQLCAGLKAGIEGAVHTASSFWEEHCGDDQTGFLLIDASNAFNEMNRIRMLYEIRYRWPSGAQFVFNCYRHWSKLLLRSPSGCLHLYSMEGVTQGDPTAMLMYGIGTLPIIHQLHSLRTEAMQLWYADDAKAAVSLII